MRYALEVRTGRTAAQEFAARFTEEVVRHGGETVEDSDRPDVVVAVGGDGTMLAAVRRALRWDVPVLGFNLGTLGFLAEAESGELSEVIRRLDSGDYDVQPRMTVKASVGDQSATGVNDVVVEKVDSTRLVSLAVSVDGAPFVTYRADGLVVATPTGSTAYSFSAGGPLIDSSLEALILTPVAAHSLFDRSMVLPPTATFQVTVSSERVVKVNVDKADLGELGDGETVSISRGDQPARFVSFGQRTLPGLIKEKFALS